MHEGVDLSIYVEGYAISQSFKYAYMIQLRRAKREGNTDVGE